MPAEGELSPAERSAWDAAVTAYRQRYMNRDVLEEGMIAIKNALRVVPNDGVVPPIAGEPELDDILNSAAPVYRAHWWPAHDALNRSWIAAAQVLMDRYARTIAPRVAAAYGQSWPAGPVPVDASIQAGPVGAYTTSPPVHVTMSSIDRGYQGLAAVEMLFHEPSHQWGRILQRTINEAAEKRGKTVPRQLWHAVMFYNAGEIARRALAEDGVTWYREQATAEIYADFCGDGCRARIATHWNPRLDGTVSFETAIDNLVAAWP